MICLLGTKGAGNGGIVILAIRGCEGGCKVQYYGTEVPNHEYRLINPLGC